MKVFELTGAALDWAVAKCEHPEWWEMFVDMDTIYGLRMDDGNDYTPSTNWEQGGPIIERCGMDVVRRANSSGDFMWLAYRPEARGVRLCATRTGPTPLVAAMRCYVESELGDEVDVPKELFTEV